MSLPLSPSPPPKQEMTSIHKSQRKKCNFHRNQTMRSGEFLGDGESERAGTHPWLQPLPPLHSRESTSVTTQPATAARSRRTHGAKLQDSFTLQLSYPWALTSPSQPLPHSASSAGKGGQRYLPYLPLAYHEDQVRHEQEPRPLLTAALSWPGASKTSELLILTSLP